MYLAEASPESLVPESPKGQGCPLNLHTIFEGVSSSEAQRLSPEQAGEAREMEDEDEGGRPISLGVHCLKEPKGKG